MELSNGQKIALNKLLAWYQDPDKKMFVTLGGYAGTGKTTLIAIFRKEITKLNEASEKKGKKEKKKIKVGFCSYTGKAAQNLKFTIKESGAHVAKDTVSTIHGLIYNPIESASGIITGWAKKEEIERDLIIVDEASMVDGPIWNDLLSYNIPIIAVGDHGQLPPISGNFNLMQKPEILLTEIHRQAKHNPIIMVSELARKTGIVPPKEYGDGVAKYLRSDPETQERSGELLESYNKDTIILCGYNSTRTKINQFIRASLGFERPTLSTGDRVICLRNNHEKRIYNGMLGTILSLEPDGKEFYHADIQMDGLKKPYSGLIYAAQFGAKTAINFTKDRSKTGKADLFDFGYAITVHKAQGGQTRKVIMFEERFPKMDEDMWRRWLYTGITRAQEELYLFGK
ncbi:MAG: ATP-dependent RecD-like DNA helicase [Elusimicrobia bacterium]|nr:ATP-dependent RecD-like DNA helicase [Elusimicrobiota bacterium]